MLTDDVKNQLATVNMGGASSVAAEPQRAEPRGWALTLSDIPPSAKAYSLEEIEQLACAGRQVLLL
jgi:hypothetical protein